MESQMIFCIFGLRIRYENIKNLGSCLIASCLSANGYAFEVGPKFCMEEIWKEVDGIDYPVSVSNLGNVIIDSKRGKRLTKGHLSNGYLRIRVKINGIFKSIRVHRLVALYFLPNPENKPHINHKKGIKTDNRAESIEWATALENNIHAYEAGLKVLPKGKNDHRSIPISQYSKDGILIRVWESSRHPEREIGLRQGDIMNCLSGKQKTAHGFIWKRESPFV